MQIGEGKRRCDRSEERSTRKEKLLFCRSQEKASLNASFWLLSRQKRRIVPPLSDLRLYHFNHIFTCFTSIIPAQDTVDSAFGATATTSGSFSSIFYYLCS